MDVGTRGAEEATVTHKTMLKIIDWQTEGWRRLAAGREKDRDDHLDKQERLSCSILMFINQVYESYCKLKSHSGFNKMPLKTEMKNK